MPDIIDLYVERESLRKQISYHEGELQRARERMENVQAQIAREPFQLREEHIPLAIVNRRAERRQADEDAAAARMAAEEREEWEHPSIPE